MSVAWSFLHVGQSMVANVFHSTEGPKAARKLAQRIIFWGAFLSINLAILTFGFRRQLPRFFTHDQGVLTIVHSAVLPAALMLGLSWNNALEGCLLGEAAWWLGAASQQGDRNPGWFDCCPCLPIVVLQNVLSMLLWNR